jgi:CBS domain-containing protein
MTSKGEQGLPRLNIRTQRTRGGDGVEAVDTTVYCPIQERSVGVTECEGCNKFHALHFDPTTRTSSVVCYSHGPGAPEASPRGGMSGPADPRTPLVEMMTAEVICVRAETSLDEVRALMIDRGIGGLPVVDADGKPIGMVSRADVLRVERDRGETEEVTARPRPRDDLVAGEGLHVYEPTRITAGEAMTPMVLALHESSNVGQAASLMAFEGIHHLPVVSDAGRVVGILSSLDVLRWFGQRSGYLIPPGASRRHG